MADKQKYIIQCWGACQAVGPDGELVKVSKCGMNYPTSRGLTRAEEGDVVDDIPITSVGWLLKGGYIEKVKEKPTPTPEPAAAPPAVKGSKK